MFSEIQRDYIQQLVLSNQKYKYYVAFTNTNINQVGVQDNVSFYVYLSDKPITAVNRYEYQFQGTYTVFAVKSGNANYNYHTERVTTTTGSSTLNINNYEFVYTNAEFTGISLQPDLLISNGVQQSHFDGFSVVLLIILISVIFSRMIRKGGGYGKL